MKNLPLAILTILMILCFTLSALADGIAGTLAGTARNSLAVPLTVYAEPDTASTKAGEVPGQGYVVVDQVKHLADNSLWAYVKVEGSPDFSGWVQAEGLIMCDYMLVVNPALGDRLNLRAEPSADALSLGKFYTGAIVTALSNPSENWQKVSIGGLDGYMMGDYLFPVTIAQAVHSYDDMPPMVTVHTACSSRSQPADSSALVEAYAAGDQVLLLGIRDDGMALVKRRGLGLTQDMGWVSAECLTPAPSFSLTADEQKAAAHWMIVVNPDVTDRLNLRESPDGSAPSVGKYYTGAVVTVLGTTGTGWAWVEIGMEAGYMDMDYLIPYTAEDAVQYAAMLPTATVNNTAGTGLNLRSYASTGSDLVSTLKNGTSVTVLGITANGYACVQSNGTVGYVLADKLSPAVTFAK